MRCPSRCGAGVYICVYLYKMALIMDSSFRGLLRNYYTLHMQDSVCRGV